MALNCFEDGVFALDDFVGGYSPIDREGGAVGSCDAPVSFVRTPKADHFLYADDAFDLLVPEVDSGNGGEISGPRSFASGRTFSHFNDGGGDGDVVVVEIFLRVRFRRWPLLLLILEEGGAVVELLPFPAFVGVDSA